MATGEYSVYSSLQANSKVKFAAWPNRWRWPTFTQMTQSELSRMTGTVEDSAKNIVLGISSIISSSNVSLLVIPAPSLWP